LFVVCLLFGDWKRHPCFPKKQKLDSSNRKRAHNEWHACTALVHERSSARTCNNAVLAHLWLQTQNTCGRRYRTSVASNTEHVWQLAQSTCGYNHRANRIKLAITNLAQTFRSRWRLRSTTRPASGLRFYDIIITREEWVRKPVVGSGVRTRKRASSNTIERRTTRPKRLSVTNGSPR
jgi:hypothetical protein